MLYRARRKQLEKIRMNVRISIFEGPRLVALSAVLCTLWCLSVLIQGAFTELAVREIMTVTVRCSLVMFLVAFTASSLRYFFKGRFTQWMVRNRRYLGISFAMLFAMHFLTIALRAWLYPEPFIDSLTLPRVVNGGVMLATVMLLALTSSDYVVRRVSPSLWKYTHLIGSFYIFYRFSENYWLFAQYDSSYFIVVGLLALALSIRLIKLAAIYGQKIKRRTARSCARA